MINGFQAVMETCQDVVVQTVCIFLHAQVAVTAYQPVDVVTRTVEVPVTRTVDVYVPKPVMREKIVEVPKLIPKYIEKVRPVASSQQQLRLPGCGYFGTNAQTYVEKAASYNVA